jgi:hypothetical protein
MVPIPNNFPVKQSENFCLCRQTETMKHIYSCNYLNIENDEISCENIFKDNVKHQKKVYERFTQSFETREVKRNKTSWGRAVPSSGQSGASLARFVIENCGHLPSIKKLRSSSFKN